ncbi:SGNH/GDSL hydrolase family protein [Streptomyces longhuiensis]|uniref:SGNH/GDSL hydrolase family protein n=1 Tax=Streptomyces longhuiensis TaxID=2880933 RepID=UPI001D0A4DA8|nr:SGNH/GDSL hydrolase family protein [Streptomyces longhuiensis]UDM05458.1 SGNH/GDSL hydrolase family protein [Streptomyces longhuiensis]
MGTVDPQGLFPKPALAGGGRIPANVLLGVMAQESNLWQAEPGSIPGQMGNPLASYAGFYGHKGGDPAAYWKINWAESDCGYGVGQVTDGMRLSGHEKEGEKALAPATQRAVALDYTVNVAGSLYILADKWNEVHKADQKITVNNDDPSRVENWFAALWNYNLGFNPRADEGTNGNWGLGWYNNPANPVYPPSRLAFMNTDIDPNAVKDAAHPQDWPYEEKVLGWAAWSADTGYSYATSGRQDWPGESGFSSAGFRPAYWNGTADPYTTPGSATYNRAHATPSLDTFCNTKNNCDSASPPDCPDAACYTQYWWHESNATWKSDCATTCGFENIKYQTLIAEPGRGTRLQYGTPVCYTENSTPPNSLIVHSMPDQTNTYSSCGTTGTDAGNFQFTFNADPAATGPGLGQYEAKGDLHQIGGGLDGHFWYAHTRDTAHLGGDNGLRLMTVTGTWTLEKDVSWARVMVHVPDTGAQTRQAAYVVGGSDSTSSHRIVEQRANRWVSIGAFHFTGTPSVTLTNATEDGTGDEDVAWDAVAFQPLPGKPKNVEVAMGDSYASGEGASDPGGDDYDPESDYYNKAAGDRATNSCHRSRVAWSRRAVLPGESQTTAELETSWSPRLDYKFIACSGARHYDILSKDLSGELPQIRQGYLDQNTTLVSLSIGGNDMQFAAILQQCILPNLKACPDDTIPEVDPDTGDETGNRTPVLRDWAPEWAHSVVRPRIAKTLQAIHEKAHNAKIVLMGYPRLFDNNAQCGSAPGIGANEAPWLNEMADGLAEEMKGAASDAGTYAVFADPRNAFSGQAVCGSPETIHGLVFTGRSKADETNLLKPSMKSFHPKTSGTINYANAFEASLNR